MPTNKLVLRSERSPWNSNPNFPNDITKGSTLSYANVDNNFIYLKGLGIYSAKTEGSVVSLYRIDGTSFQFSIASSSGDTYVTGGTYDSNTSTLTLSRNDGGSVNVTGFTSGGSSNNITASNGITKVGDNIVFGGPLTGDTNIQGNQHELGFGIATTGDSLSSFVARSKYLDNFLVGVTLGDTTNSFSLEPKGASLVSFNNSATTINMALAGHAGGFGGIGDGSASLAAFNVGSGDAAFLEVSDSAIDLRWTNGGVLTLGGNAGLAGQTIISQGSGASPTWGTISANSDTFYTVDGAFANGNRTVDFCGNTLTFTNGRSFLGQYQASTPAGNSSYQHQVSEFNGDGDATVALNANKSGQTWGYFAADRNNVYRTTLAVGLSTNGKTQYGGSIVAEDLSGNLESALAVDFENGITFSFVDSGSTSHSFSFPKADGSNGQAILTDGAGNLSWGDAVINASEGLTITGNTVKLGGTFTNDILITGTSNFEFASSVGGDFLVLGSTSTFLDSTDRAIQTVYANSAGTFTAVNAVGEFSDFLGFNAGIVNAVGDSSFTNRVLERYSCDANTPFYANYINADGANDAQHRVDMTTLSGDAIVRTFARSSFGMPSIQFTAVRSNANGGMPVVEMTVEDENGNQYDIKLDLDMIHIGNSVANTDYHLPLARKAEPNQVLVFNSGGTGSFSAITSSVTVGASGTFTGATGQVVTVVNGLITSIV